MLCRLAQLLESRGFDRSRHQFYIASKSAIKFGLWSFKSKMKKKIFKQLLLNLISDALINEFVTKTAPMYH